MADLQNFYFTGKHSPEGRSRISFLPLLDNISSGAIDTIIANLETLSNLGEANEAETPKLIVYGVTQQLIGVEAVDDVLENDDVDANPLGFDGYMLGDITGAPKKAKIRQPFSVHGFNRNFILPGDFDETADASFALEQFLKKWAKVRRVEAGALKGKTVTSVVITSAYKMH